MLSVGSLRQEVTKWKVFCLQPKAKVREADLSAPPTSNRLAPMPFCYSSESSSL
jgi:hypothetical protein